MRTRPATFGRRASQRASITLGGVSLPPKNETLHTLLVGSTGVGKTTLIDEVLAGLVSRGDRAIVVDPGAHHLTHFGGDGDIILNPFDQRGQGWTIFNEIRKDFDYFRLAKSLIPDGHGPDASWHFYSQILAAEGMRVLMRQGENTTMHLLDRLTSATVEELAKLLSGTQAQGLFDRDAGRALASTRFILTTYLNSHQYLQPGSFSLRDWLADGDSNLYITWREDMQAVMQPLIGCWVDLLCNAVLSLQPSPDRRLWLLLDELGALGQLSSLEGALTRGRKHGLCVIAGLQSTAQLDRVYGRETAISIRSCFRNLVVLSLSRSDPDTSEILSKALGDREIDRVQYSTQSGMQGISRGESLQRSTERLALPSELTQLADLTAYVALAGNEPVRQVGFSPVLRPAVQIPFMEGSC
ncbi:type IV secretion system DNA-binding domain-containing protein [Paraburkholderia sp. B3]|uniref:type IV secretion system DNA-binding domain-containing protein n=1 Tax=Paraburkholderia sp. B3 TaxID=3134791 RepID=UPI003981C7E9